MADTLIAGAGLAGLSCAAALKRNFTVLEGESRAGGLCRSESVEGFTIDRTGHYLHFRDEAVRGFVLGLLGRNSARFARKAWIYLKGIYTRYPFQANTYGHDKDLVRECVLGFLRASRARNAREPRDFEEWIRATFGEGIARHFMLPYNRKMLRVPLKRLAPYQGGRFVPRPLEQDVIDGALFPKSRTMGYNPVFYHPRRGGIEALVLSLGAAVRGPVMTECALTGIDWRGRNAYAGGRGRFHYDVLVSTVPLPSLISMLRNPPAPVVRAARGLKWVGVVNVNFLLDRPVERGRHWAYYSESRYPFYRLGFPANIVRADAPPGGGIISAEVSRLPSDSRPLGAVEKVVEKALIGMGLIRARRDILRVVTFDIPFAYVLFDREFRPRKKAIMEFLSSNGIVSIGRYGGWKYSSMEETITEGLQAGRLISARGRRAPSMAKRILSA